MLNHFIKPSAVTYKRVAYKKNLVYKHTGYNIGFDSRSEFLFTDWSYEKNIILFGADMSSSAHVDN